MIERLMFVGGEFYYDGCWKTDEQTIQTDGMCFLNGGTACLTIICDFLLDHGVHNILLPSYLCPTIIETITQTGMQVDYYRINRSLTIDLEDLESKLNNNQAVYFINYFGFTHNSETSGYFQKLQRDGRIIIEDNAQAGFVQHPIGDFVFNSMRKLVPFDGGYLITRQELHPLINQYRDRINRRLPVVREYRKGLYNYLVAGGGDFDHLVDLFELSEHFYQVDHVALGDPAEQFSIEHLDWKGISRVRCENYLHLLANIKSIPEVEPIYLDLPDAVVPMGLPVYFTNISRDFVNEKLSESQIGLSIHWDELLTNPRTKSDPLVSEMAGNMLTLTIDQRFSTDHMDYLTEKLKDAIHSAKLNPNRNKN